jgi:hypothetical protein
VDIVHKVASVGGGPGIVTASVECGGGKKVLGGGAFTAYGSAVTASFPTDGSDSGSKEDDVWGTVVSASEPVEVTVTAACVNPEASGALKYRETDFNVSAFEDQGKTVVCGGDYQITGGGWSNDGDAEFRASKPQGKGAWRGSFAGGAADSPVHVFAICAKGKFAKHLSYHVDRRTVQPGKDKSATNACRGASEAVGGGGTTFGILAGTGIAEFQKTKTSVRNPSLDPTKIASYGICYD